MRSYLPRALVLATTVLVNGAAAQAPTLNLTAGAVNTYVWRGVTLADQTSLQGDVSLGIPVAGGTFTAGAWGTAEISPDSTRFSTLTDFETGFGEIDLYAQFARSAGPATLAVGFTALRFPEIPEWDTNEVFGSVSFAGAPLSPSLIVRKDIDAVGGFYAEGGIAQSAEFAPGRTLNLSGIVGYSSGQADDGDLAWYADEGFTHLQLTASTAFALGGFTLTPSAGLVYGVDDFAKVDDQDTRVIVGISLSRSFGLGN
jgi:uncharacterized protein (TIGR02001 family)